MNRFWGSKASHHEPAEQKDDISRTISASNNDPAASATQASGTAWLAGHLHHLTPEQEKQLENFKKVCAERNYYTAASAQTEGAEAKPASHDDATLLRFLRARKFDIEGAWTQFKDTEDWRKENALEDLYANISVDSYEATRRMYPQWTGRRDRRGIPIYVFEIGHLTSKEVASYNSTLANGVPESHKSSSTPARLLNLFALYEHLLGFVMPLCTALPRPNPETPIVTSTNIVDVSGVGLKQFWNLKSHMQDASVLATAHYPETLDRIFIVGAPGFFPTVWGWIKRWFDPGTTSKIFILSAHEVKQTLTSFMEPASIPKRYGGELEWEWNDMPNLDEPAHELVHGVEQSPESKTKPELLKGPMLFKKTEIQVLGSEDGKDRRITVPVPQKELEHVPVQDKTEPAPVDNEKAGENVAVNPVQTEEAATEA